MTGAVTGSFPFFTRDDTASGALRGRSGARRRRRRRGLCLSGGVAGRLAFAILAFVGFGFEEDFGGLPVALGISLGASFLEPKEVSDLPDAVLTIGHD